MGIESFSIPFSQPAVDDLRGRLERTRWPDEMPGANWEYGVDLKFLQQICEYWRDRFDWKAQVERFSTFHHYRYLSDSLGIPFIHERGKGLAPDPLILTHGWPGSIGSLIANWDSNFVISPPVSPSSVAANTSQIRSRTLSSNGGTAAINRA